MTILHKYCLLFLLLVVSVQGISQTGARQGSVVVHVKFKEGSVVGGRSNSLSRFEIEPLDKINRRLNATSITRLFPDAGIYEDAHRAYGLHLWYAIEFDPSSSIEEAVASYGQLDYFEKVEKCAPYFSVHDTMHDDAAPTLSVIPSDASFNLQWHLENRGQTGGTPGSDINVRPAWEIETGKPNVIVAVIDGGIDIYHPDLRNALWVNADEIPNNRFDDDHNGYIDDVNGYSFGDQRAIIWPDNHGTHVAGIIGATTNDGSGIAGIAGGSGSGDGIRLMSLATFGLYRIGGFEAAMVYAADNGAVICQNSWGGGSSAIEAAIGYFNARAGLDNSAANYSQNIRTGPMAGGVVIFAAGNANSSDPNRGYPGSLPSVIAVGSTDHNDQKSTFSNFGTWVDVFAPGDRIFSSVSLYSGTYATYSGTSMACPQVSGVAALIVSKFQGTFATPSFVRSRLLFGSSNIDAINPSYAGLLGSGRVNAEEVLQAPDAIPPATITNLSVSAAHFNSATLQWTSTGASGMLGTAFLLDLRYSETPITESNFQSALRAPNLPRPLPGGSTQSYTLKDLLPSHTYYFAAKLTDSFTNTSGISNIATATTPAPPTIDVLTTEVSSTLHTGSKEFKTIIVRNGGGDDLTLKVSSLFGMTAGSPPPPVSGRTSSPQPPLSDGQPLAAQSTQGVLFAINTITGQADQIDLKTGAKLRSVPLPELPSGGPDGLAYSGRYLYYVNGLTSRKIHEIDPETGAVHRSFQLSVPRIDALAWSGNFLYAEDGTSQLIYEIDVETGLINRTMRGFYNAGGLTFGGNRQTLFLSTAFSQIFEMDYASGNVLRESNVNGSGRGLAYSEGAGLLFYANQDVREIEVYDPSTITLKYRLNYGYTSALAADEGMNPWVSPTEVDYVVPPGATMPVSVEFDADQLAGGIYQGTVRFFSNDPSSSSKSVPAQLTVINAANIKAPENIDLGQIFVGEHPDTLLSISNSGKIDLQVTVTSLNPELTVDQSAFIILPGDKFQLKVTWAPGTSGMKTGAIRLSSNDFDEPQWDVHFQAEVLDPPTISLSAPTISETLATGEEKVIPLTITNSGGSTLHWVYEITGPESQNVPSGGRRAQSGRESNVTHEQLTETFSYLTPSPELVGCLAADPFEGFIYGKSLYTSAYYRYDPRVNSWSALASTNLVLRGQATYLNGKIYNAGESMGIYNIATNQWTSIAWPYDVTPSAITNDGHFVYAAAWKYFFRYDPQSGQWTPLAELGSSSFNCMTSRGALSYTNGMILANLGDNGITGNGTTALKKYFIAVDAWSAGTVSIPGKTAFGSAIHPTLKKYYTYGPFDGTNFYVHDILEGTWETKTMPATIGTGEGLVFLGLPGYSGIYFGGNDKAFGRYSVPATSGWITPEPPEGSIPAGQSQLVQIKLSAKGLDAGNYSGQLIIKSKRPQFATSVDVDLEVLGAPDLQLAYSTHHLETYAGRGTGKLFKIRNKGSDVLSVSSIRTEAPFAVDKPDAMIQTSEDFYITVEYFPTHAGKDSTSLIIESNDPDQPTMLIPLVGIGIDPPIIKLAPDSIVVNLFTGEKAVREFAIHNIGGSYLEPAEVSPAWSLVEWHHAIVDPGDSVIRKITLDASGKATGNYYGDVEVTHHGDYVKFLPMRMSVTGSSFAAIDHHKVDFSERLIGKNYDSTIHILNAGVQPLQVSAQLRMPADVFSIIESDITLAPGESVDLNVRYRPDREGEFLDTLRITSNDPLHGMVDIPIHGIGTHPPHAEVTPGFIEIDMVEGTTEQKTINIGNSGFGRLTWQIHNKSTSIPLSAGEITDAPSSPVPLTALVADANGVIYGRGFDNYNMYRFDPINGWQTRLVDGIRYDEPAGAVIFNSRILIASPQHPESFLVFKLSDFSREEIPNPSGISTANITTDGTFIYMAGANAFGRFNPLDNQWHPLPLPRMPLTGLGGLVYFDGVIYAHTGASTTTFSKFVIAQNEWIDLPPTPDGAGLGAAIDPLRRRYYAMGPENGDNLYEFDMVSESWSSKGISGYKVIQGQIAFSSADNSIYFVRGRGESLFGKYEPDHTVDWLRSTPLSGNVGPATSEDIILNIAPQKLRTGTYQGEIKVLTNDSTQQEVLIPVTMHLTNSGPEIWMQDKLVVNSASPARPKISVPIMNKGLQSLTWSISGTLPAWLTATQTDGTVSPQSTGTLELTFDTNLSPRSYTYPLIVTSNDPVTTDLTLEVQYNIRFNGPPILHFQVPTQYIKVGDEPLRVIAPINDPDFDALTFEISTDDEGVVHVSGNHEEIFITPVARGFAMVQVRAIDPFGAQVSTQFKVIVRDEITGLEPAQPILATAFPNPFTSRVLVSYMLTGPGSAHAILTDQQGREIWAMTEIRDHSGPLEFVIEGLPLSAGIYLLRVSDSNGGGSTIKLVKYP